MRYLLTGRLEPAAKPESGPRSPPSSSDLLFLDGMRGLAAFYVMVGHARWLLWEGFREGYVAHRDDYGLAARALVYLGSLFRFGHEAVLFFFVLSGFVIHLKYARRLAVDGAAARFDLKEYLLRRARRLYPPLVIALLLTLGLDLLGQRLGLPTASATTRYDLINANVGSDHRPITALRNLLFVMAPVFGSDGPLWSLGYEGYFYALYPLVFWGARRSGRAATMALIAFSIVGFLPGWPGALLWLRGIARLMIVWWLGALLATRFVMRPAVRSGEAAPVPYRRLRWLALALLVILAWRGSSDVRDIIIGVGFVGVLAAGFAARESAEKGWPAALARLRPLGAMSYTLYVVHFPILVLMSGWLMKASGGSLPAHFGWVGAGIGICTGVGYALHFVVERPFTSRH